MFRYVFYKAIVSRFNLRYALFCLVALAVVITSVALHHKINSARQRGERDSKNYHAMIGLINQHQPEVAQLLVADPAEAIRQSAERAGILLEEQPATANTFRLHIEDAVLPLSINWLQQLNAGTGIRLKHMQLSPSADGHRLMLDAELSWQEAGK